MDLSPLVIPITLLAGFLIGLKIRNVAGLAISTIVGAIAWVLGLIVLAGGASVFSFDVYTQILMVAFGALTSLFGWVIGANFEFLRTKKKRS